MMPFIKGMCESFILFCNIQVPLCEGQSIPAYVFLVAGLGFLIVVKFLKGLYA